MDAIKLNLDLYENDDGTYTASYIKDGYKFVFSRVEVAPWDENADDGGNLAMNVQVIRKGGE